MSLPLRSLSGDTSLACTDISNTAGTHQGSTACPYPVSPPPEQDYHVAYIGHQMITEILAAAPDRAESKVVGAPPCIPPYPLDDTKFLPKSLSFRSEESHQTMHTNLKPADITHDTEDNNAGSHDIRNSTCSSETDTSDGSGASTSPSSYASNSHDPRALLSVREALTDPELLKPPHPEQKRWTFFDMSDEDLERELMHFSERCERCGRTVKECEQTRSNVGPTRNAFIRTSYSRLTLDPLAITYSCANIRCCHTSRAD